MNYGRMILSAAAATIVFSIYGFLVHGLLIAKDYVPHPVGVYRSGDAARSYMPLGLIGIFIAILVFAAVYAKSYEAGCGSGQGARLGVLFGILMPGAFVAVNYTTINISGKLALELAASELIEWTLVGIVVRLVYKPAVTATRPMG